MRCVVAAVAFLAIAAGAAAAPSEDLKPLGAAAVALLDAR